MKLRACIVLFNVSCLLWWLAGKNAISLNGASALLVAAFQPILPKTQSNHRRTLSDRHLQSASRKSWLIRRNAEASNDAFEYALLFDCDGVILETEELHRLAYNEAFRHFKLTIQNEPVVWSVSTFILYSAFWTLCFLILTFENRWNITIDCKIRSVVANRKCFIIFAIQREHFHR